MTDDAITSLAFSGFGLVFGTIGGFLLYRTHKFVQRAIKVIGTVVHVERVRSSNSGSGSSVTYRPTFEYTDGQGNTRRARTWMSASGYNFSIGSRRTILVDPDGGEHVRVPGFWLYGFPGIFFIFGAVFFVVGVTASFG